MGGSVEGSDKDKSGGAGTVDGLQCVGLYGDNLRDRELGSDRVNAESSVGVTPSVGP